MKIIINPPAPRQRGHQAARGTNSSSNWLSIFNVQSICQLSICSMSITICSMSITKKNLQYVNCKLLICFPPLCLPPWPQNQDFTTTRAGNQKSVEDLIQKGFFSKTQFKKDFFQRHNSKWKNYLLRAIPTLICLRDVISLNVLRYLDMSWHILSYLLDISWHMLTHLDISWHILAHPGISWRRVFKYLYIAARNRRGKRHEWHEIGADC